LALEKPLERIYGLDALRAFTMYLGVILHASIAYKAGHHPRYWVQDQEAKSYFFDTLYFWIHSFRMPLFFLLSGFFTVLLFEKIGASEFIRNRAKRILIPLAICLIVILPFSVAPFTFSRLYFGQGLPLDQVWPKIFDEMKRLWTFREFKGLQHFWFLANLIYFYIAFLVANKIGIRFEFLKMKREVSQPLFIGILVLATFVLLVSYLGELTPSIWTGPFPKNPQLVYYGFYYGIGIFIYFNKNWLTKIRDGYAWFLIMGTVISLANVYFVNNFLVEKTFNIQVLGYKFLYAVQVVFLSFGCIGFCLKYFNFSSEKTRYFSDASYWVYIIHLFFVASLQILNILLDVYPPLRFVITLTGASLISYISYHLFVRYTVIGNYLHGPRKRENLKEQAG
jgi:glucans biosynthesis protein C